ncbi:SDR family oxidoreductase [Rhizobium sp. BK376]|uniref:SDR family NAD(P)-dependent oxidoreductase n=1 Tax=Rhizobium sp. BK376 TaxID=2512149 RepID=UPI00104CF804|nr:SDR family oxidoreductase [Rhizobium sp. BK376]TCR85874.1 3-oxoacyl-[acyl-carrier protein] reductase [Rhizobium sp. BK376]
MTERNLEGRVAVVTGAARNIGREIALRLASEGAAIVVNTLSSVGEAEGVAEEIRSAGGKATVVQGDVSSEEGAAAIVSGALDAFGRIDCLVNNAAVRRETPFAELSFQEWREVLSIILDGAFLMSKAAQPALSKSDNAAIINIGGMSAHTGAANRAHVVTAKTGLVGLTRALAHDLASDGITVNCVVPGMIGTVRGRSAAAEPSHHAVHNPLVGRRGKPSEIAALVEFLASPDARYITGQTIHANGGVFMP